MAEQMRSLGWEIGDVCYSTISHHGKSGSVVPGSKGRVTGPGTGTDVTVTVRFDSGLFSNMGMSQIKTLANVRTAQPLQTESADRETASETRVHKHTRR